MKRGDSPSSWTKYPHKYKFTSVEFAVSDTISVTNRETYSLLQYLGDIGGLVEFLFLSIGLLIHSFGSINLKNIVAKKLYSWISPTTKKRQKIEPLKCLELRHAFWKFLLCNCPVRCNRRYKDYEANLKKVDQDILVRFDFIKFSRRVS